MTIRIGSLNDYRAVLNYVFEQRRAKNARYSLRSFAKSLGVSPSTLSEVMSAKHGLSLSSAKSIAQKLDLSRSEQKYFCDLVLIEHGANEREVTSAKERIKTFHKGLRTAEMNDDAFKVLADWTHYAILALTEVEQFRDDPKWIAKKLEITPAEVEVAMARLFRLNLLEKKDGLLRAVNEHTVFDMPLPSVHIRGIHKKMLAKAADTIDRVPIDKRAYSGTTFAVSEKEFPALKELVKKFREDLVDLASKHQAKDSLYYFAVQLFPLQTENQ